MIVTILTLFPEMFSGPFDFSIVARARSQNKITLNLVNLRDFAADKYRTVDDRPYGGGGGMLLRVDVVDRALKAINKSASGKTHTVLLDPKGKIYNQATAKRLAKINYLTLICGHYEGVDARVVSLVDESISVGPYILTGGEIAAMILVDSITRLVPGVLSINAIENESFVAGLLEQPQYTRPQKFRSYPVPQVLLGGHHARITAWKKLHRKKVRD